MRLTSGISWEIVLEVAGTAGFRPVAFTCCFGKREGEMWLQSCLISPAFRFCFVP